ncbi:spermidine/putrescine ABC transporter ATP-binding protein PotA [Pseudoalteromonas sp. SSDWG2]|uniref:spermidine/putrescine ABC transporter ATP-binding protein PotA n=1 Tax=Pseudoalteromonas sp. SSDWG2 TaxID=3139391 RepID=UPI003BA8AAD5
MATSSGLLSFQKVSKSFDQSDILNDFNLDIFDGEFFTILGPSGCGKTTVLRLIAGFESPDSGIIAIDGQNVNLVPAEQRPVNTVFQSYALFPHMSVADNVGFGLKMSGVAKSEREQRVQHALELVKLSGFEKRMPTQLSGGQKQRVAIARAIVMRPKLILLDESLSALDYKLRQQMQMELKQIQRQLGVTFVYVTHDQEEALSMSDRILVMNNGQAQQIGTPRDIYEQPVNLFVARFIGEINVFDATIVSKTGEFAYLAEIQGVQKQVHCNQKLAEGDEVHVLLRPEDLRIEYVEDAPNDSVGFFGHIKERSYTGQTLDSLIEVANNQEIRASEFFNEDDPDFDYRIDQKVWINWVDGWEHVIKKSAL